MQKSDFVSFVGPPELHDSTIVRLEPNDTDLTVIVRDDKGGVWNLVFSGVVEGKATKVEGMILYALAEFVADAPLRRFVFLNWDEEDESSLYLVAQDFHASKSD